MAAVATATREITFGAMVTPLARRRPWVLARQAATLDRLSGGRLVIGRGPWGRRLEGVQLVRRGDRAARSRRAPRRVARGAAAPADRRGRRLRRSAAGRARHAVPAQARSRTRCRSGSAARWPNRAPLARAARAQGCFPIFRRRARRRRTPADLAALRAELAARLAPRTAMTWPSGASLRLLGLAERAAQWPPPRAAGVTWLLEGFGPGGAGRRDRGCRRGRPAVGVITRVIDEPFSSGDLTPGLRGP